MSDEIIVTLPKFITHARISKNKYKKISGQRMFVGVNHYIRDAIVKRMHAFIEKHIPKDLKLGEGPFRIRMKLHVPANYGTVRMIKGKLAWKPAQEGYACSWDADNMWIWGKCFNDVLVNNNYLSDDNIYVVRAAGEVEFVPVEDLEDRKIEFIISKYEENDESREFSRKYSGNVLTRKQEDA